MFPAAVNAVIFVSYVLMPKMCPGKSRIFSGKIIQEFFFCGEVATVLFWPIKLSGDICLPFADCSHRS